MTDDASPNPNPNPNANASRHADVNGRRVFFLEVLAGAVWLAGPSVALAAGNLDPSDPYAKSMGFRLNTAEVDQARYPRHTVEQHCQFCQLWNGGDKDFGNCSFFDNAITPKMGWCRNFKARKAAAA